MRWIVLLFFVTINSFAFVRLQSESGNYIYWSIDRVPIYYNPSEFTNNGLDPAILTKSVNAWLDSESFLTFAIITSDNAVISPDDSINTIKVVNGNCMTADGEYFSAEEDCKDEDTPSTLAYTITTTADTSGRIVDADIVVGVDMIGTAQNAGIENLTEILIHEMGHFIGLEHVCEFGGDLTRGIPDCQPYSREYPIMYPSPIDPSRQQIYEDDRAGLLSIYRYPIRKYKGCGFFGSVDTNDNDPNFFNLLILAVPLFILYYLRRRSFSFSKIKNEALFQGLSHKKS